MSRIFISYRRDDSSGYAVLLYDHLSKHFGSDQIFMDIAIEPGLDFVEVIEAEVGSCDALIALIGKRWLSATDEKGKRRLDNPEDYVRLEIKAALDRGIRVIPALVSGAVMPDSRDLPEVLAMLARRNAIEISDSRFHYDSNRLIRVIERILQVTRQPFEPEMTVIPAGEFLMGSDSNKDENAEDDEQPQHVLFLPDYYMAKTPVTNTQYTAFVETSGHRPPDHWENGKSPPSKQEHPVVRVNWHDAVAYCHWLSETSGTFYRLPTEAEWEKAARGTTGLIYPWGNRWDAKRCNTREDDKKGDTTPVGAYPGGSSPFGLLDMAGNVFEWCITEWQKAYPYDVEEDEWSVNYLQGPDARVVRGGSWGSYGNYARGAFRFRNIPSLYNYYVGFRLVSPI